MLEPKAKNLLLTGQPGCGKTTVVRRVIERLSEFRLAGFYTDEIRRETGRLGFDAIGLGGRRIVLAHVSFRSKVHVGRYGVDLRKFEPLVEVELTKAPNEVDVFVIDEIGKMECSSPRFVGAVRGVLAGPVPVLATVGLKGGFLAEVKRRPDIRLVTVTATNRDRLPEELAADLRRLLT